MPRALLASLALLLVLPHGARGDVPAPPMQLPGQATAAATRTWLLGTKAHVTGARRILPDVVEVPAARARGIARRLGRRLTFAEPNRPRTYARDGVRGSAPSYPRAFAGVAVDPLTALSDWRGDVIDPALDPPAVSPTGPLLALVDAKADVDHPEFRGQRVRSYGKRRVRIAHGTETLGVAVAPANGFGVTGAYPGARAANFALPPKRISCADSAQGIRSAILHDARVISMSYGSRAFCQAEYEALQLAVKRDITLVAAGGNERGEGNPYEFPASLPHVITVGASAPQDKAALFSNASAALDVSAPGVGIYAPLPRRLDTHDTARNGYELVAGTSFSTPIVAASALWLRTVRPRLDFDQVTTILRRSAKDIGRPGYDVRTGYGKLDLAAALLTPTPGHDRGEPNDDFRFVDGRAFSRRSKVLWHGRADKRITASVDLFEDPVDVYRIRIPGHRRATITLQPALGNSDLAVYRGGSGFVALRHRKVTRRGRIAQSRRRGTRRDRVRLHNRGGLTRTALVVVYQHGLDPLNSAYALRLSGGS